MNRSRWAALLIALLAVAAGVAGIAHEATQHSDPTPYYLTVGEQVDSAPADETVAFDELTPPQQRVFESARSGGPAEIPSDVGESVWIRNDYVRYQNTTYRVAVSTA